MTPFEQLAEANRKQHEQINDLVRVCENWHEMHAQRCVERDWWQAQAMRLQMIAQGIEVPTVTVQ